ncbi:MAG: type II secretion system F family protein [Candidatus Omnitrophica bacterium]|nr:type II secretion system F family protein [Candidatus Omnitrophota bacterium]
MAKFFYIARTTEGKKDSGAIEAATQDDAVSQLQAKNLLVVSIFSESKGQDQALPLESVKIRLKPKHFRITSNDLMLFCRQLATLLGAGVTILKSLNIIKMQVSSKRLANVIADLSKNMESGLSFHEAMSKQGEVFSDLWVNLVESGEASGNLAVVLTRLAGYLERNEEFKNKIVSALIYPIILIVVGTGALLFMTIKIIPTFAAIFGEFGVELPLLTKLIIGVSVFIRTKFILILIIIAVAVFLIRNYIRTREGRRMFEKLLLNLPVFGEFFHALLVERFSSEMSTLLESGVPILYALDISENSVNNFIMGDVIRTIKTEIRDGKTLGQPFEKSGFFEPMVVQLVSIGEEIGDYVFN